MKELILRELDALANRYDNIERTEDLRATARILEGLREERIEYETMIEAEVVVESSFDFIVCKHLAKFLSLFHSAYHITYGISTAEGLFARLLEDRGIEEPPYSIARYSRTLAINRISFNSPLDIVLAGSAVGLVFAIILSGGEIELSKGRIKAKLQPLGKGVEALAKALRLLDVDTTKEYPLMLDEKGEDQQKALLAKPERKAKAKGSPRKKPKQSPEA